MPPTPAAAALRRLGVGARGRGRSRAAQAAAATRAARRPVTLSEARVLACHDTGARKTPAEQCDHVAAVEQALAQRHLAGGGVQLVVDGGGNDRVRGRRELSARKVKISLPRERHARCSDRKVARSAAATAVREAMEAVTLDGADHEHARYKIAVTATYRGQVSRADLDLRRFAPGRRTRMRG